MRFVALKVVFFNKILPILSNVVVAVVVDDDVVVAVTDVAVLI